MASNPISCSNCGTENPPDQDFCTECGQPLTASAEQGLRENEEAEDHGSILGGRSVGLGGDPSPLASDVGTADEHTRPHA